MYLRSISIQSIIFISRFLKVESTFCGGWLSKSKPLNIGFLGTFEKVCDEIQSFFGDLLVFMRLQVFNFV